MGREPGTSLLLVEDDDGIADPLAAILRREGYTVDRHDDGRTALVAAGTRRFDLYVLDVGLPGLDGLEVCRRLRAQGESGPILMLTALAEELDAVVGLDAGADDYLAKPVRVAELLARARALLRRSSNRAGATAQDGDALVVDRDARRVLLDGIEVDLTPKEFDLLALLEANRGAVVSRERIMDEVWDENWFGSTKTLDIHISSLRRKLGDPADEPRFIATLRGVGYRFEQR